MHDFFTDPDETLVNAILGEEAPAQRRDRVWSVPLSEGRVWTIRQRTAVCELAWGTTPCTTLARLDPLGRHVCDHHWDLLWICFGCGAWLPEGTSGSCSPPCARVHHATQTWLGKRLGARYTTPE